MGPPGNRRAPLRALVGSGIAEMRPDPARPRGWTLLVNDVPQSYVDLDDPGHLHFPYERQLGAILRLWATGPVRQKVLHLGGGGLTLPRFLDHLRPDLEQVVVERDPQIVTMVDRILPIPKSIEIRFGDARAELEAAAEGEYGLIISDVFVGAAMPESVAARGFAEAAHRALRPGGLFLMNLTDVPPLTRTRIQVATTRSAFDEIALYGDAEVLRGLRVGNMILLAGNLPMIKAGEHESVLRAGELQFFSGGATPLLDEPR